MKFWHKIALVGVMAAGLVTAGAVGAWRAARPTSDQIFDRLSNRLACQCGCNQHLAACNHHPCGSADPMRAQIRASISAGKSEQQIADDFVKQYGNVILAAPPAAGFSLAAYLMPVVALLIGGFVVVQVVKNLRRQQPVPAAAGAGANSVGGPADAQRSALIERYGARIDEELERDL